MKPSPPILRAFPDAARCFVATLVSVGSSRLTITPAGWIILGLMGAATHVVTAEPAGPLPVCEFDADCASPPFVCQRGRCAGLGAPGADAVGCVYDPIHTNCDDGVDCTLNACVGASGDADGCAYAPVHADCDDGISCTDDACDPVNGCVSQPVHARCTDSNLCSINLCGPGPGAGTDGCRVLPYLPGAPCLNDLDCSSPSSPAATCNPAANTCHCIAESIPELCLVALPDGVGDPDCFGLGGFITLEVRMGGPSLVSTCAAQFFLSYDTTYLDFISMQPAGSGPFLFEVFEFVNESLGTIDYAVGPPIGGSCTPTTGPAVLARVTFRSRAEACQGPGVCFRNHNPPTRLADVDGHSVFPLGQHQGTGVLCEEVDGVECRALPCCTGSLSIDDAAPVLTCPASGTQTVNADCRRITRTLLWDPVTAVDNCGGPLTPQCQATYHRQCTVPSECGSGDTCAPDGYCLNGVVRLDLLDGGAFPQGCTRMRCSVVDDCANASACAWEVCNTGLNRLCVDVELSPTMVTASAQRGIELRVSDCGDVIGGQLAECLDLDFGPPHHPPGHAATCIDVPPGNWLCLEARDPHHSLRSTCGLDCIDDYIVQDPNTGDLINYGDVFNASFKGSPNIAASCHWLVQGNVNGDAFVDILDFIHFLDAQGPTPVDTSCGLPGIHADFNGSGVVDTFDFSFILINFFNTDKAGCDVVCDQSAAAAASPVQPRLTITVHELRALGLGHLAAAADLNEDGTIDFADLADYLNAVGE